MTTSRITIARPARKARAISIVSRSSALVPCRMFTVISGRRTTKIVKMGATSEIPNHIRAITAQARLGMVSATTICASKKRSAVRLTPMKIPRPMLTKKAKKKPAATRSRVAPMWTTKLPETMICQTLSKTGIGPGKSVGGKNQAIACQTTSTAVREARWTRSGQRRHIDAPWAPSLKDEEDFIFWHRLEEAELDVLLEEGVHVRDQGGIPSGRVELRHALREPGKLLVRFDHQRLAMPLCDALRVRLNERHGVHYRPEQLAGRRRVRGDPILVGSNGEGNHGFPGLLSPEPVQTHHLPVSFADQAGIGHGDAGQGSDPLALEVHQAGGRRSFLEHDRVVIDQSGCEESDFLADQVHPGC